MPQHSTAEERLSIRERRPRVHGRVDGGGSAPEEAELRGLRTRRGARAALRSFRRGEASEQASCRSDRDPASLGDEHGERCRLRWASRPPLGPVRDVVTVARLPLLLLRWISAQTLLPHVVECAPLAEIDEPVSPVDRFRLRGEDEQLGAEPGVLLEAQRRR